MASVSAGLAAGGGLICPSVVDLGITGIHPLDVTGRLRLLQEVTNKGHYDKTSNVPPGGAHQNSIRLISGD